MMSHLLVASYLNWVILVYPLNGFRACQFVNKNVIDNYILFLPVLYYFKYRGYYLMTIHRYSLGV
jgi:hypothetical protein